MATIRRIERKHGPVFVAELCVNGIRKSATFDSKARSMMWAEETEELLRAGLPLPGEVPAGDMDFTAAVDKYALAVGKAKKMNTRRLDHEISKRLINYFGGKSLLTITTKDVAEYQDYRLSRVGSSSVIQDLSFLSCLYRMARVEWGLDVVNPAAELRRPSAPKHRLSLLEPRQIDALLDWCCVSKNEKLYCYVLLQLHTAMRPSEGAGLRWNQVLPQGIIDLSETKTDPRRVPLTATAKRLLDRMRQDQKTDSPYVFLPAGKVDLVQPHRYFRRSFATACRAAGIANFTLYGLRHSAASYLIMNGVDIRTVAEIMGHRNISQTMKYTHFLDAHKIAAIGAIDRLGV
ncbi:MAG: tyrosine-type recombinase/integrase [Desulfobulbus sp.]|nr:tyrosine-type recombinase/integrase [Desulfobulbus sp.]